MKPNKGGDNRMGIWIDENVYNWIIEHGGVEGDDVEVDEEGNYWFLNGDWTLFGLTEGDGGIYTITTRPSQKGVFIGNYEG